MSDAGSRLMDSDALARFEALLAAGKDGALLRVSLGQGCLAAGRPAEAIAHLDKAIEFDPDYSAAWKFLAKAHEANGDPAAAADAYKRGIAVAASRGDQQLVREMEVFLRRLAS